MDFFADLGLSSKPVSANKNFPAFPQPPSAPQNLIQRNQTRQSMTISANQSSANLDDLFCGSLSSGKTLKSSTDLSSLDGLISFNKSPKQNTVNNISLNNLFPTSSKNNENNSILADPLADIFK